MVKFSTLQIKVSCNVQIILFRIFARLKPSDYLEMNHEKVTKLAIWTVVVASCTQCGIMIYFQGNCGNVFVEKFLERYLQKDLDLGLAESIYTSRGFFVFNLLLMLLFGLAYCLVEKGYQSRRRRIGLDQGPRSLYGKASVRTNVPGAAPSTNVLAQMENVSVTSPARNETALQVPSVAESSPVSPESSTSNSNGFLQRTNPMVDAWPSAIQDYRANRESFRTTQTGQDHDIVIEDIEDLQERVESSGTTQETSEAAIALDENNTTREETQARIQEISIISTDPAGLRNEESYCTPSRNTLNRTRHMDQEQLSSQLRQPLEKIKVHLLNPLWCVAITVVGCLIFFRKMSGTHSHGFNLRQLIPYLVVNFYIITSGH